MPSLQHGLRAVAVAATAMATVAIAPVAAQATAPQLTLTVQNIEARPADPLNPWTYLGLEASADWSGLLRGTRLRIDEGGLGGVATAFVPEYGADGSIHPDENQCHRQGAVTVCELGDRAPNSWFPLPFLLVQATPGAAHGSSGTLRLTVTGTRQSGEPIAPLVATPTVTVA